MRTGRTLTVFWKLETAPPPKIWSRHPPENLEQAPPPKIWSSPPPQNLEQAPPQKFGAGTPPGSDQTHPPPVNRMNDRRLWKYYLGQNFVSAGNNAASAMIVAQIWRYNNTACNS